MPASARRAERIRPRPQRTGAARAGARRAAARRGDLARPARADRGRRAARRAGARHRRPDARGNARDRGLEPPLRRERRALHDRHHRHQARHRPRRRARRSRSSSPAPASSPTATPIRCRSGASSRIAQTHPAACGSAPLLLAGLLEAIINRIADVLERVGADIEAISQTGSHASPPAPAARARFPMPSSSGSGQAASWCRRRARAW